MGSDLPLFARLNVCACATLGLTIAEYLVSHYTHSITLLVCANQSLYNLLSLIFGAVSIALKKSNAKYLTSKATYGWNRMEVLGSMISLVFLASLCFGTAIEALQTIFHSGHLDLMHAPVHVFILSCVHVLIWFMVLAYIGGYSTYQWKCLDHEKTTHKPYVTPYLKEIRKVNIFRDLQSCGLLMVTCISVYFIDEEKFPEAIKYIDPSIALFSILLILITSYTLLKTLSIVLLQSKPYKWDIANTLTKEILETYKGDIVGIHEFHIWSLMHGSIVATLHVTYKNTEAYIKVNTHLNDFLISKGVTQMTIQPEFAFETTGEHEETEEDELINNNNFEKCWVLCKDDDESCETQRCCKPKAKLSAKLSTQSL